MFLFLILPTLLNAQFFNYSSLTPTQVSTLRRREGNFEDQNLKNSLTTWLKSILNRLKRSFVSTPPLLGWYLSWRWWNWNYHVAKLISAAQVATRLASSDVRIQIQGNNNNRPPLDGLETKKRARRAKETGFQAGEHQALALDGKLAMIASIKRLHIAC